VDGPRARDFTTAAKAAWRIVREPTLRLAFKDLGFSLRDRGDDAFLVRLPGCGEHAPLSCWQGLGDGDETRVGAA
jgi:hypothetical protein